MTTTFIIEWDRNNLPSLIVALDAITMKTYELKQMIYSEAYKAYNTESNQEGYQ